MSKVQIIALKTDRQNLISLLHNLGVLHVETSPVSGILAQLGLKRSALGKEDESQRLSLEGTIKKIREILPQMKPLCAEDLNKLYNGLEKTPTAEMETRVNDIETKIKTILQEKERFKEELLILSEHKKIIGAFLKTSYDISRYENLECIALIFPRKFASGMKRFQQLIESKIKHKVDIYLSDFDAKKTCALLFYDKKFSGDIDEEIFKKGTQKFTLPQEYLGKSFKESFGFIEARQKVLEESLLNCEKGIDALARENFCFLQAVKFVAQDRLEELLTEQRLAESEYTVTITGWLPTKRFQETKKLLEERFENRIIANDITKSVSRRDEVPILLDNPRAARPFELLLSLLQPPKYGSFDPTKLLSVFFPLFFGLMVGDAGYGLVLLALGCLIRRIKKPIAKDISKLVIYISLSCIAFGVLFAEFFGDLAIRHLGAHPMLFHRQEDIVPFLVLAVSIGVGHVLLGLVLGVVEGIKQKHKNEAFEKAAIIASLFGLFFLVATLSDKLPDGFFVPSLALLVIALAMIIRLKGFIGPLEVVSAVANILSYARIMALGVAGVMVAHIANTMGGLMGSTIIGVIVASLIHILNIVLSVFSPTIQSLRLHYVEFFPKFYELGGKKYMPFQKGGDLKCTS